MREPFYVDTIHVGGEALGRTFAALRATWSFASQQLGPQHAARLAVLANNAITKLDLSDNELAGSRSDLSGVHALCAALREETVLVVGGCSYRGFAP